MEKAILVVHKPNRCADCPLRASLAGEQPFCFITYDNVNDDEYYKKKPSWCPLIDFPSKRDEKMEKDVGLRDIGFIDGYNACIDDILKGK